MKILKPMGFGLALVAVCALAGCYAGATPDAVYVDAPPPEMDVSTYPQQQYDGQTVYYVNDHWYARRGDHWAYYRNEPAELEQRRGHVVSAPPAREQERHVEHASPAREQERQVEHAPPPHERERQVEHAPPPHEQERQVEHAPPPRKQERQAEHAPPTQKQERQVEHAPPPHAQDHEHERHVEAQHPQRGE